MRSVKMVLAAVVLMSTPAFAKKKTVRETETMVTTKNTDRPSCTRADIEKAAEQAPADFKANKANGREGYLYGANIWRETAAKGQEGYLACAATVSAILRKAGCGCIDQTIAVDSLYGDLIRNGFQESGITVMGAGDILIWNSNPLVTQAAQALGYKNTYPGVGKAYEGTRVLYRHIGIATSQFFEVDNSPGKGPESKLLGGGSKIQYAAPVVLRLKGERGCAR